MLPINPIILAFRCNRPLHGHMEHLLYFFCPFCERTHYRRRTSDDALVQWRCEFAVTPPDRSLRLLVAGAVRQSHRVPKSFIADVIALNHTIVIAEPDEPKPIGNGLRQAINFATAVAARLLRTYSRRNQTSPARQHF